MLAAIAGALVTVPTATANAEAMGLDPNVGPVGLAPDAAPPPAPDAPAPAPVGFDPGVPPPPAADAPAPDALPPAPDAPLPAPFGFDPNVPPPPAPDAPPPAPVGFDTNVPPPADPDAPPVDAPPVHQAYSVNWDAIAACESGGNWGSTPVTVTPAACSSRPAPGTPTVVRAPRVVPAVRSRSG